VYVFAQFDWEAVPEFVKAHVLRKVSEEGKGLVLTWQWRSRGMGKQPGGLRYPMEPDAQGLAYMTSGVPFRGLPYFSRALGTNATETALRNEFDEKAGEPANVTNRIARCVQCYRYGKGRVAWMAWPGSPLGYWGQPSLTPTLGWTSPPPTSTTTTTCSWRLAP